MLGCNNHTDRLIPRQMAGLIGKSPVQTLQQKGISLQLNQVVNCSYPAHDPIYLRKKYKKLVLIDMSMICNSQAAAEKDLIIPAGSVLWDSRGNAYEATPGVIAMAQNSHCIKGDDLDSYNAVWNATIRPGETKRAFMLGFELPADAVPAKFCWNRQWERQNLFFILDDTLVVKN